MSHAKKIDNKGAIVLEFRVAKVGAFPDLDGVAKSFEASSNVSSSVSDGRGIVLGRKGRGEKERV
jgi:hypothetical protein